MRPDMEDYDELPATDEAPRSRAMSWLVLGVAVGGFAALAYYAYHSGTEATREGDMLVVRADENPIKETPAEPGGEEFANKDKTIYDVISANGAAQNKVEKLLPEPEKPLTITHDIRDAEDADETSTTAAAPAPAPATTAEESAAPSNTTTFVNKDVAKSTATADAPAPAKPVAASETPLPKKVETSAVTPSAVSQPKPAVGAPTFVNESTVAGKKTEPETKAEPAKTKEAAKPKEKPKAEAAKPATKSGSAIVQLGAYKSEEEAQGAWKKIAAKFGLGGSPNIIKAELPNGTFYRLRTGVSDAKATCAKLTAQKQPCMPVK